MREEKGDSFLIFFFFLGKKQETFGKKIFFKACLWKQGTRIKWISFVKREDLLIEFFGRSERVFGEYGVRERGEEKKESWQVFKREIVSNKGILVF